MWTFILFVILVFLLFVFVLRGTAKSYLFVGEQLQEYLWMKYVKVGEWETDSKKSTKIKMFDAEFILDNNELSLYFTHEELKGNHVDYHFSIGSSFEAADSEYVDSSVSPENLISFEAWNRIKELCYKLEKNQK
jgi:hypothetical protein